MADWMAVQGQQQEQQQGQSQDSSITDEQCQALSKMMLGIQQQQGQQGAQIQGIQQQSQACQGIPFQGIPVAQYQPQGQVVQGINNMNINVTAQLQQMQYQQIQTMPQMQSQQIQGISQISAPMQNGSGFQGYSQIQEISEIYGFPQQQMYQSQMPQMCQSQMCGHSQQHGRGFKLLQFESSPNTQGNEEKEKDKDTKLTLAAVIITICDGGSYDTLFSSVKQDVGDSGRVDVYSCSSADIKVLREQITHFDADKIKERSDDLDSLLDDLKEIEDPSCVAINYECCAGCSDSGFSNISSKQIIEELTFFLQRGFLTMYSDFSLKALIKAWNDQGDSTKLGPNPFLRTGDWSQQITLNFNPFVLKTSVSSQLQAVGELCPKQDFCTVHCMGGTVRYGLNPEVMKIEDDLPFNVKVLTVAKFPKHQNSCSIQVPDFSKMKKGGDVEVEATKLPMKTLWGDAGHVVLDYTKRESTEQKEDGHLSGKILLSMTHWSELVKLGDSIDDEVLFKVAAKNMGVESTAYQQMVATYESMGGKNASGMQQQQQQMWVQQQAQQMVQQQAPCNNTMNSNIYGQKKGQSSYF